MTTLLSAEKYKLLNNKTTRIILIGVMAMTVLFLWISSVVQNRNLPGNRAAGMMGQVSAPLGQNGVMMVESISFILMIWLASFIAFFTASEFQNGTIRNVLSLGKSRTRVFLSRLFSACILLAAMFASVSLVATAGFTLLYGFGDMGSGTFLEYFAWNFIMQLLYHLPYAAVFCAIAFLSKSPGLTIALGIAYQIAIMSIMSFLGEVPDLKFILKLFPEYYISGFENMNGDPAFIVNSVLVSITFTVMACMIGCAAFKKADVK